MVVAYATAGGFLFQMIEEEQERESIQRGRMAVLTSTDKRVQQLWNIAFRVGIFSYENWTAEARTILKDYQVRNHSICLP